MRRFVPRLSTLGGAAAILSLAAFPAAAVAQSMLGNSGQSGTTDQNTVVVPPAPPMVPAAPAAPMPQVITPQSVPPGLVQTPLPPPNMDNGQAGTDGTAPDDNAAADMPTAVSPAAPTGNAPAASAPGVAAIPPAAAPDTAASTPPPPANDWLPAHTAEIGLLDKVDGGASTVSIPVGGQTNAGDLQINVLACVTRPPGEIPDDALFVSIQPLPGAAAATASAAPAATASAAPAATDAQDGSADAAGGPIFRGWMVRSIPGATVVGDASETLRVVSCS
jgi:hypothetical protein